MSTVLSGCPSSVTQVCPVEGDLAWRQRHRHGVAERVHESTSLGRVDGSTSANESSQLIEYRVEMWQVLTFDEIPSNVCKSDWAIGNQPRHPRRYAVKTPETVRLLIPKNPAVRPILYNDRTVLIQEFPDTIDAARIVCFVDDESRVGTQLLGPQEYRQGIMLLGPAVGNEPLAEVATKQQYGKSTNTVADRREVGN